jgi:putative hydrolase of the HAD superfamily
MTKALLFDLGDVIVGLDFDRVYRRVALLLGRPASGVPALIREADLAGPYERGELSSAQFHRAFCQAVGIDVAYGEFCEIWEDMFPPELLVPESFFESVRGRYRLVLLSNTNEIHFDSILRRYSVLRWFDDFVLSYRVGALKPSPAIYQEAVRVAGCRPAECFFTDDKTENIEGAVTAGLDAVRFEGWTNLEQHLRQRSVV